jgi:hypothetical protein
VRAVLNLFEGLEAMKLPKMTAVVVIVLALLAFLPVAASANDNRRSCYGEQCDSVDPADTVCVDDAVTLASRDAYAGNDNTGILELRYSRKCHSNWVRFTPWSGITSFFSWMSSGGQIYGKPWIWRLGVPNSLRGMAVQDNLAAQTTWTYMVTADGTTCWSVGLQYGGMSNSGQYGHGDLGTYNAPCMS